MHDFQHVCVLGLSISISFFNSCFFLLTKNTHRVLYFYFVWSVLSKKFFSFYVFICNLFFRFCFVFRLFSGQPKVFGSIYGWTKDLESTPSGQDWVKRLRSCLAGNVCVKGVFWFKGVYSKHSLMPVLTVLFQGKMSFCQIKPIYKKYSLFYFLVYGQKNVKNIWALYLRKYKIFWHVLKNILYGFYNKFVRFQRIWVYISNILKIYFWQENIIHF